MYHFRRSTKATALTNCYKIDRYRRLWLIVMWMANHGDRNGLCIVSNFAPLLSTRCLLRKHNKTALVSIVRINFQEYAFWASRSKHHHWKTSTVGHWPLPFVVTLTGHVRSLRRVIGLHCWRPSNAATGPIRGLHFRSFRPLRLSVLLAVCPAYCYLFLSILPRSNIGLTWLPARPARIHTRFSFR